MEDKEQNIISAMFLLIILESFLFIIYLIFERTIDIPALLAIIFASSIIYKLRALSHQNIS